MVALTYRPYRISSRITGQLALRGSGWIGATAQASADWSEDPAICPKTMLHTPNPEKASASETAAWPSAPVSSQTDRERKSMFRSRSASGIVPTDRVTSRNAIALSTFVSSGVWKRSATRGEMSCAIPKRTMLEHRTNMNADPAARSTSRRR